MDSEGVRWNFSSLKGAARVHDMPFMMGGFSWFCNTSCSRGFGGATSAERDKLPRVLRYQLQSTFLACKTTTMLFEAVWASCVSAACTLTLYSGEGCSWLEGTVGIRGS